MLFKLLCFKSSPHTCREFIRSSAFYDIKAHEEDECTCTQRPKFVYVNDLLFGPLQRLTETTTHFMREREREIGVIWKTLPLSNTFKRNWGELGHFSYVTPHRPSKDTLSLDFNCTILHVENRHLVYKPTNSNGKKKTMWRSNVMERTPIIKFIWIVEIQFLRLLYAWLAICSPNLARLF